MKPRATLLVVVAGTFLSGLTLGQVFMPSAAPVRTVEAEAIDAAVVNRIYQELTSTDSPLALGSSQLAKIAQITMPSVVHIQSQRRAGGRGTVEETGSGVIMSSERHPGFYVVTNRHVIDGAELSDIEIRLYDGTILSPERIWSDADTDVAVMKVSGRGLQAAHWGDSDELKIGNMVLAMGSPFGLSQSVTYGIISAKGRRTLRLGNGGAMLNQDFLQTDAAINPGNSGGPLIDLQGRIVGINTAIASNSGGNEGIGFSIPSNLARKVFHELIEHGSVRRAYLGVKLDPTFDIESARRLGMPRVVGARVLQVYAGTPAASAGLKIDDVVVKFNDVTVQDENHLINLVSLTPIGTTVNLTCWRDKREVRIRVELTDRDANGQRSERPGLPDAENLVLPTGLSTHSLTPELAGQLGLKSATQGVLVTAVASDSPWRDRLQVGDVIESLAGTRVDSSEALTAAWKQAQNAEKHEVLLQIRRLVGDRDETRLVVVPLGE